MESPRRNEKPNPGSFSCPECMDKKNQFKRHLHFLQFGNDEGALGGHLRGQYGDMAELDGTIRAILAWVRSIKEQYGNSKLVDDNGVPLPVWRAWGDAQEYDKKRIANEKRQMDESRATWVLSRKRD